MLILLLGASLAVPSLSAPPGGSPLPKKPQDQAAPSPSSAKKAQESREVRAAEQLLTRADALRGEGRHKEAAKAYIRVLEVFDGAVGSEDLRMARALEGLSISLEGQGLYEDAAKMGLKGARIYATVHGPRSLEVAFCAERLARVSALGKQFAQSLAYYEQALSIESERYGPKSPKLVPLLEDYSAILRRTPRKADLQRIEERLRSIRYSAESAQ
ncbi:MAG: tetratricopeptide repeat protein [Elusimicrobiota bacterium]